MLNFILREIDLITQPFDDIRRTLAEKMRQSFIQEEDAAIFRCLESHAERKAISDKHDYEQYYGDFESEERYEKKLI